MIKSVVYRRILLIYPTKGNGSICHPELFAIKKTLQISKNGELRNFMKLSPARTRGYLIKGQATTG
jgi:hypothetical protein